DPGEPILKLVGNNVANQSQHVDAWTAFSEVDMTKRFLSDGIVKGWKWFGRSKVGFVAHVLRPAGGTTFNLVGKTHVPDSAGCSSACSYLIPSEAGWIRVKKGDHIGWVFGPQNAFGFDTHGSQTRWCHTNKCGHHNKVGSAYSYPGGGVRAYHVAAVTVFAPPASAPPAPAGAAADPADSERAAEKPPPDLRAPPGRSGAAGARRARRGRRQQRRTGRLRASRPQGPARPAGRSGEGGAAARRRRAHHPAPARWQRAAVPGDPGGRLLRVHVAGAGPQEGAGWGGLVLGRGRRRGRVGGRGRRGRGRGRRREALEPRRFGAPECAGACWRARAPACLGRPGRGALVVLQRGPCGAVGEVWEAVIFVVTKNKHGLCLAVKEWAGDPEVQAKARHFAGMAMEGAGQVGQKFVGCIEQGPAGVQLLAFVAGASSCTLAVLNLINIANLQNPVAYLVSVYLFAFALSTMLFEAKPEWIEKLGGPLNGYQDLLLEYCKFFAFSGGRGMFYIFQGVRRLADRQVGQARVGEVRVGQVEEGLDPCGSAARPSQRFCSWWLAAPWSPTARDVAAADNAGVVVSRMLR
ncbi:unnamed protein product, partial [Prorocentrum cordatum]